MSQFGGVKKVAPSNELMRNLYSVTLGNNWYKRGCDNQ